MDECYFKEAANTLKASRWTLWMATLFGRKETFADADAKGGTIRLSTYRGKRYMIA
jgi:hypothetical protein